jgi:hyperosmotically inducible periplasmic protein
MTKSSIRKFLTAVAVPILVAMPAVQAAGPAPGPNQPKPIEDQVRHKLVTLPYLSLFDDLSYRVDGGTVTLFGEVTEPYIKSDAEHAVKHIEGVTQVNNQIEVLPLSPMDQQIRMRTFRALFRDPSLQRYAMGTLPSIRIIVKNGNVTLTGIVSNQMDKNLAFMRANGVPGVFSVTNNLRVGS